MTKLRQKFFLAVLAVLVVLTPFHLQANQGNDLTVFQVKIVADQFYRNKFTADKQSQADSLENWKKDLIELIDCANQELQKQGAKVKLEIVEIAEWEISEEKKLTMLEALRDLLNKISDDNYDLIIGITNKEFPPTEQVSGYQWENFILVKDNSHLVLKNEGWRRENKKSATLLILLHEIGHFLGLEHSDKEESIMHATSLGSKFLKEEIELINKNAPKIKKLKSNANPK